MLRYLTGQIRSHTFAYSRVFCHIKYLRRSPQEWSEWNREKHRLLAAEHAASITSSSTSTSASACVSASAAASATQPLAPTPCVLPCDAAHAACAEGERDQDDAQDEEASGAWGLYVWSACVLQGTSVSTAEEGGFGGVEEVVERWLSPLPYDLDTLLCQLS